MSLIGWFTDKITGQPSGTTDASAALGASADAGLAKLNSDELAAGTITQDQYDTLSAGLAGTADSGLTAYAEADAEGLGEGVADATLHPITTVETGLDWEGSEAGSIAGGAISSVTTAVKNAAGGIFSGIPWWLYIVAALALFVYLGGGGFLERKARRRLSQ